MAGWRFDLSRILFLTQTRHGDVRFRPPKHHSASPEPHRTNILSAMRALSLILLPFAIYAGVADHPEVLGQERLFESWIHGQMTSRHLPGIAVGVVFDNQLIWAKGFGS